MRTKCFTNFKLLVENVGPKIYGMLGATMPLGNTILGWRNERSLQLVIAYKLHCMCIDACLISSFHFSTIWSGGWDHLRCGEGIGNVTFYCKLNSFRAQCSKKVEQFRSLKTWQIYESAAA